MGAGFFETRYFDHFPSRTPTRSTRQCRKNSEDSFPTTEQLANLCRDKTSEKQIVRVHWLGLVPKRVPNVDTNEGEVCGMRTKEWLGTCGLIVWAADLCCFSFWLFEPWTQRNEVLTPAVLELTVNAQAVSVN